MIVGARRSFPICLGEGCFITIIWQGTPVLVQLGPGGILRYSYGLYCGVKASRRSRACLIRPDKAPPQNLQVFTSGGNSRSHAGSEQRSKVLLPQYTYISALLLLAPTIRTFRLGSNVAVCPLLAMDIEPVALKIPVVGS